MNVTVRKAEARDLEAIRELFSGSVITVCANDYSSDQLKVWASSADDRERWFEKIQDQFFLVAARDEMIVGFGSLGSLDKIDLLYVHPECQRAGVASQILNALLLRSKAHGTRLIKADVSKTARPFFESQGFQVLHAQTVLINGISLVNYEMAKQL